MKRLELRIDVTDAADLGQAASLALTVHLPDATGPASRPIVCFAKSGGGYGRGYFTECLPGPGRGAQAPWHAARGWVFVSVDQLGVGSSTMPSDPTLLDFRRVAAANQAVEDEVLARLRAGTLDPDHPALDGAVCIGIGHSLGGCTTIVQQGRYHRYDGVAVLGFGAFQSVPATPPGAAAITLPWIPRDAVPGDGVVTNAAALAAHSAGEGMAWCFFHDDVDPSVVAAELEDFPARGGDLAAWQSATVPATAAAWCVAPGAVAPEAAAITVPVLVAMGERDVIPDPKGEPRAYLSATSVDLFVCPRMGHMHNFASTREALWHRIDTWADWVRRTVDETA